MRVSKVKVLGNEETKGRIVLMHRSPVKGQLIYSEDAGKRDRTEDIIPEQKLESFHLSILNKTFLRKEFFKKELKHEAKKNGLKGDAEDKYISEKLKEYHSLLQFIDDVLSVKYNENRKAIKFPEYLTREMIEIFLNHKFRKEVTYTNKNGASVSFLLSTLILNAIEKHSVIEMQPFVDWRNWFVETKSKFLKKSIINNCIPTNGGPISRRRETLMKWRDDYFTNAEIDLARLHKKFGTDTLMASLREVPQTEKSGNEYHRLLKSCLQSHQKKLFGKRAEGYDINRADNQLYVYNTEVVKYMEHYFPVKSSKRRNSTAEIKYYLQTDTIKCCLHHQIINAVRGLALREGKFNLHGFDDKLIPNERNVSSSILNELKTSEGFVLNMLGGCAFAANCLRNIVDATQRSDLLGFRCFEVSLKKGKSNSDLFALFFGFGREDMDDDSEWEKHLYAARYSVSEIRNRVAHYHKSAIENIYNITDFEYRENSMCSYTDTKFTTALQNEIYNTPKAFSLQLMTGKVLEYYPKEKLVSFFQKYKFSLYRSVVPFAPGFKNIMRTGVNYQNATQNSLFYDMGLTAFQDKDRYIDDVEAWNARYFFMKLIYNNLFLPRFTNDKNDLFRKTVEQVLEVNRSHMEKVGKDDRQAFGEVRQMRENETANDYMAYLQSSLRMEKNKKELEGNGAKRINFEKFILQMFVKGFDSFLKDGAFEFVHSPENCLTGSTEKERAKERNSLCEEIGNYVRLVSTVIDPGKGSHVAFYVFCKMLNSVYLSNIRNEMIKYHKVVRTDELAHLIEIIELCLLSADAVSQKTVNADKLSHFFAEGVNVDDDENVIHASMETFRKYGTRDLFHKLMLQDDRFLVSSDDYREWEEMKEKIEGKVKQRELLHAEWCEAKEKDKKSRKVKSNSRTCFEKKFMGAKAEEYYSLCKVIDKYNWLDNKLHLVHLNKLHNLVIEILGRMVGFTALFERDFQYICKSDSEYEQLYNLDFNMGLPKFKNSIKGSGKAKNSTQNIDHNATGIGNSSNLLKENSNGTHYCKNLSGDGVEDKLKRLFLYDDYRNVRNFVAHFNYLTRVEDDLGGNDAVKLSGTRYSLIELINELRNLLKYDRKLKNAVSKSFIDMFERHGMHVKMKLNHNHKLFVDSISPRKIKHLGGGYKKRGKDDKMYVQTTNHVDPLYCDMCRALLEMK